MEELHLTSSDLKLACMQLDLTHRSSAVKRLEFNEKETRRLQKEVAESADQQRDEVAKAKAGILGRLIAPASCLQSTFSSAAEVQEIGRAHV